MSKCLGKIQEFLRILVLAWIESILAAPSYSEGFKNIRTVLSHFIMGFNDMSPTLVSQVDFVFTSGSPGAEPLVEFLGWASTGSGLVSIAGGRKEQFDADRRREKEGMQRVFMLSTFCILGPASVITDNILRRQTNITRRMYGTRLPYYALQTAGV